jgi:hypothetical protein
MTGAQPPQGLYVFENGALLKVPDYKSSGLNSVSWRYSSWSVKCSWATLVKDLTVIVEDIDGGEGYHIYIITPEVYAYP